MYNLIEMLQLALGRELEHLQNKGGSVDVQEVRKGDDLKTREIGEYYSSEPKSYKN